VPRSPASHRDRSEFFCTKGILAVKINMLPSSWKDLLQKGQCFGIFARLIFVQEARKDSRVVIDYHISNQCARLIANAIIYYNSAILSRLLTKYEAIGNAKALKKMSPGVAPHPPERALHIPRRRTDHRPGCHRGGAGVGLTKFSGVWAYNP
jgi:hypothetical protein